MSAQQVQKQYLKDPVVVVLCLMFISANRLAIFTDQSSEKIKVHEIKATKPPNLHPESKKSKNQNAWHKPLVETSLPKTLLLFPVPSSCIPIPPPPQFIPIKSEQSSVPPSSISVPSILSLPMLNLGPLPCPRICWRTTILNDPASLGALGGGSGALAHCDTWCSVVFPAMREGPGGARQPVFDVQGTVLNLTVSNGKCLDFDLFSSSPSERRSCWR